MNMRSEIFETIEETFSKQTPSDKRISTWLLNNREQIPYETADSIAQATGTSGITVGRYLRKLGFRNLDDMKNILRNVSNSPYKPWGVIDRLDSWEQQKFHPDRSNQSLKMEIEAIKYVYQLAKTKEFLTVSQKIATADAVIILGIQSTRGTAHTFFSHLEYLRPRVIYADGSSGSWLESLNSEYENPYVVLTDTRAYSAAARQFCRVASETKVPVVLVTDIWCPWARDYPIDLLQVKTDTGNFWDSLAPLSCLFNLLLSSIVEQLGPKISARLEYNRKLQQDFGQFEH
ncbi:transcriptional regulator [Tatumella ptyseos ATCC 33301]|uniref:Transcriptional regulator n=2 Tax=Tatumella ptyseos TaxID=82987 RepID=A0A085JPV3_9GAMM|nr:MurR/RpiR family transcriptional regulator [Tatumella ptyseos]KFD22499.1 transcriptional regulator [Tatumella ptyseos ATCC 33301]SQK72237.1 Helix-turn-helix domain, rpiR family [Tatumella ptyseos]